jgi:alkanesulfonate monooxygenase SsuD/methylene tetrahydromethanopterin reductase-like flavin-dependent oxidoreductase (luciferase family)
MAAAPESEGASMRFGIEVVPLGEFADPREVVRLARAADRSGWEMLVVWDHLGFVWGTASGDPWVTLAAVAQATERIRIGTTITPLARRRPHVLANAVATLDLLSQGRAILGAGLGGVAQEFTSFGEPADPRDRAERLDESLEILGGLFAGRRVDHHGRHFTVDGITLAPLPLQRPRVPIWIGGDSRPALRRAARWDGWTTTGVDEGGTMITTPDGLADRVEYVRRHRADTHAAFDVAMSGLAGPGDGSRVREYGDAGVTIWLESLSGIRASTDDLLARVEAGPPS